MRQVLTGYIYKHTVDRAGLQPCPGQTSVTAFPAKVNSSWQPHVTSSRSTNHPGHWDCLRHCKLDCCLHGSISATQLVLFTGACASGMFWVLNDGLFQRPQPLRKWSCVFCNWVLPEGFKEARGQLKQKATWNCLLIFFILCHSFLSGNSRLFQSEPGVFSFLVFGLQASLHMGSFTQ